MAKIWTGFFLYTTLLLHEFAHCISDKHSPTCAWNCATQKKALQETQIFSSILQGSLWTHIPKLRLLISLTLRICFYC